MKNSFEMRTRTRAAGPSSMQLLRAGFAICGIAIALAGVALIVVLALSDPPETVVWGLGSAAAFAISYLFMHLGGKKGDKERAAGYTTSRWGYPNVEQVDEATGLIVRSAGEALLSRQVIRSRIAAYKASLEVPHES